MGDFIKQIEAVLTEGDILTGNNVSERVAGIWRSDNIQAQAIVRPTSTAEVSALDRALPRARAVSSHAWRAHRPRTRRRRRARGRRHLHGTHEPYRGHRQLGAHHDRASGRTAAGDPRSRCRVGSHVPGRSRRPRLVSDRRQCCDQRRWFAGDPLRDDAWKTCWASKRCWPTVASCPHSTT